MMQYGQTPTVLYCTDDYVNEISLTLMTVHKRPIKFILL